ncbi:LysE family translocator [Actinoallomurus iriomotensis]|uniref:Threonine transporter RhtB n=1 Tax=Actinoallomurus iriomotensis TaxID=478107 RepID=A0A9W6S4H5_9ACTN|nr:LysE family translocator [Actinoallomurus iriomotensis]GLY86924.1 threonine transporter RhtB [Actinoallomurus iriomotensis]
MIQTLFAFAGAAIVVALVPGPSTAVIVRQSVTGGRRAGVAAMLGNETGVVLWGLAAAFGLTALLLASRIAYDAIRIAGAVFLVWMGVRALWSARRRPATQSGETAETGERAVPVSRWRAYRMGLLTNAANPKAGVFAVSFLPQFVPHGAPVLPVLVVLSLIWALIDMVWYLSLIWLAGRAGRALGRPAVRRRLEQVSGVVLVGLGLRLAAESR